MLAYNRRERGIVKKWIRTLGLIAVILPTASCGLFKNSLKADAFYCPPSAYVDEQALKPKAPTTVKDTEFHQVAGANVINQNKLVTAYGTLKECVFYWHPEQKPSQ